MRIEMGESEMDDNYSFPEKHGLYNPELEKDSCGVGFIANIKGKPSHQIVLDADTILQNMDHRGGCGCERNTGDGAGILTALPHKFLQKVAKRDLGVDLPVPGKFAAGLVFLPRDSSERAYCKEQLERLIREAGQTVVGWRKVPVEPDLADIGPSARRGEPWIEQIFVSAAADLEGDAFERRLYLARKQASHLLRNDKKLKQRLMFYVCSLSTKVMIYKGMLRPCQILPYYPDLKDPDFETHLAMVHSRFSTNTFPSWDRAQPLRFMSHNGEINTLRGNVNWMRARQGMAAS
jgi:glutamate synthase (NADPH) large chain